jgi:hypothetical protein
MPVKLTASTMTASPGRQTAPSAVAKACWAPAVTISRRQSRPSWLAVLPGGRVVQTGRKIAPVAQAREGLGEACPGRRGRRQVVGEVDRTFERRGARTGRLGDEAAPADMGDHQALRFGGGIGLGHRADPDAQHLGQPPVGRKLRAGRQKPPRHVGLERRGDALVDITVTVVDPRSPFRHGRALYCHRDNIRIDRQINMRNETKLIWYCLA